jgi:hypothetical protein
MSNIRLKCPEPAGSWRYYKLDEGVAWLAVSLALATFCAAQFNFTPLGEG